MFRVENNSKDALLSNWLSIWDCLASFLLSEEGGAQDQPTRNLSPPTVTGGPEQANSKVKPWSEEVFKELWQV